jgi:hypothetical protein
MILFIVLSSLILTFLLAWLWVERSRRLGVPRATRQRRKVGLELFGSAVCVLAFVRDRHSLTGGFLGAVGLFLLVQSVYTIVKYATRVGAEREYRPRGAPPPIE